MQQTIGETIVHYESFGEGIPIISLHGFPEDHEVMTSCLEPIFQNIDGFQRIYLDLPGMGASIAGAKLKNADDMVEALVLFIKKMLGDRPFLLIGQSYGGYLSLALHHRLSEKVMGLFLLCPCVVADRASRLLPNKQVLEKSFVSVAEKDQADFSDFLEMAVIVTEDTWRQYQQQILPGLKRGSADFQEAYQQSGYGYSFEENFLEKEVRGPFTVLAGKQDDCVGYQDAFDLFQRSERGSFVVVDRAGHNLQIEQPVIFEQQLIDWLAHFSVK